MISFEKAIKMALGSGFQIHLSITAKGEMRICLFQNSLKATKITDSESGDTPTAVTLELLERLEGFKNKTQFRESSPQNRERL